jgi:hypothetical protein
MRGERSELSCVALSRLPETRKERPMIRKQNTKPELAATETAKSADRRDPKPLKSLSEIELLSINAGKWYDWSKWT